MNASQINAAIAKELGWKKGAHPFWFKGDTILESVPNFYGSLDVCAMLFDSLGIDAEDMAFELWKMLIAGKPYSDRKAMLILASATAPQRCEAFLRLKSLWKE